MSSAFVDQSGLPRGAAGSHDADLLHELHEPIGNGSGPLVNRNLVAAALSRLTQEHRDVLGELYLRRSSVAQAAHALGIAPGTVKSRTYYALRALRLAIEELRSIE